MSMFRVKEIETVLRNAVTDQMKNILLIHENGGVIAAAYPKEASTSAWRSKMLLQGANEREIWTGHLSPIHVKVDHSAVALLSSAATEYKCAEQYVAPDGKPEFEGALFYCENALVACRAFMPCTEQTQILLAVWCPTGGATLAGLLLSRLELLQKELECLQPLLKHSAGQPY
ncbi:unnamed protein product [Durusdinium trenchii]|uniref:Roadblock/LAMTOR2 domain-containing protein n=1 Tax=Durusdinium trenchii TaxID=1381693 RepID=A0ABP0PHJ0_9DINO